MIFPFILPYIYLLQVLILPLISFIYEKALIHTVQMIKTTLKFFRIFTLSFECFVTQAKKILQRAKHKIY